MECTDQNKTKTNIIKADNCDALRFHWIRGKNPNQIGTDCKRFVSY